MRHKENERHKRVHLASHVKIGHLVIASHRATARNRHPGFERCIGCTVERERERWEKERERARKGEIERERELKKRTLLKVPS